MKRKVVQQSAQPHAQPQINGTVKTSAGIELAFRVGNRADIPKLLPPRGLGSNIYAPIIDALRALPKDGTLVIPVPQGQKHAVLQSNILSSVRRALPDTRSRATQEAIILWLDPEAAALARQRKAAATQEAK
jgi:hypothetical protein